MAAFQKQLSLQVSIGMKNAIAMILTEDRQEGLAFEADVVRAAIKQGLPLVRRMTASERLRYYAELHREAELEAEAAEAAERTGQAARSA